MLVHTVIKMLLLFIILELGSNSMKTLCRNPVADPDPEIRCSGRAQNVFFYPSFPSKKLRFTHMQLSKVMMMIIIIIIIIKIIF